MSTKAKMTLGITTLLTVATVYGVHYQQMSEKEVRPATTLRKQLPSDPFLLSLLPLPSSATVRRATEICFSRNEFLC